MGGLDLFVSRLKPEAVVQTTGAAQIAAELFKVVPGLAPKQQPGPSAAEHSTEHCYLELFGMVIGGTVPGMVVNDTPEPMDEVRMDVMQLQDKPPSDLDPNPNSKLVGWQKRLEIGTCRARLSDGLNERFPIGDHDHLSYSIWISSRYWTFRETIEAAPITIASPLALAGPTESPTLISGER